MGLRRRVAGRARRRRLLLRLPRRDLRRWARLVPEPVRVPQVQARLVRRGAGRVLRELERLEQALARR